MTGTCRNSPAEIRFILELSRRGLKRAEIATQCDLKFKHKTRTANSIGYVIGKWKNDPAFAEPAATAPAQPSQICTDAAKAFDPTRPTSSHQRQKPCNGAAQQGYPPLHHGQQPYTPQPTNGSMKYQMQGGQFSTGLGGNTNGSYPNTERRTSPLHARPSYPVPSQQQFPQCPPMNNSAQIPGTYPPLARPGPGPVQQAFANDVSPLNSEEERQRQIIRAEAYRKYLEMQAPAQPQALQQPLGQAIDPRLQMSSSPTSNQFQGSIPIQQTSGQGAVPQIPYSQASYTQQQISAPGTVPQSQSPQAGSTKQKISGQGVVPQNPAAHSQQPSPRHQSDPATGKHYTGAQYHQNGQPISQPPMYPPPGGPVGAPQKPSAQSNSQQQYHNSRPLSHPPTYPYPVPGQVGAPQKHSLQSSPQQVQTSSAIYPTSRTHTPPQYPPQMSYTQNQAPGYMRPPPNNLHAMTDQRVQQPAADPLLQHPPYGTYSQLQRQNLSAMAPPPSPYMNYQQGQIYGPRPCQGGPSTNYSPQMGLPSQQTQNDGRVSLSPNLLPHLNQPYRTENVSSPHDHSTTSSHKYPSIHGVGIKEEPDMILYQPSRSGRDSLQMFRGMVFNEPFDQTGWSVIFPGNPRVPPPSSRVVKLWEPQFLGTPMFKGQYVNRDEVAATVSAVAVDDDMDANLAFESHQTNQAPQALDSSSSSIENSNVPYSNASQVASTHSSQPAAVNSSPAVKDLKSLPNLPAPKRRKVKASPMVNKPSPGSQSTSSQSTGPRNPSPTANNASASPTSSNGYIHTPQAQESQLHHQLQDTSTNVGPSSSSEPAAGPFVPGTWCGIAPQKTNTIKPGDLTLLKKPDPNFVPPPPPPPQALLNLEHYRNNYVPQEGFKSKASMAPNGKGNGRRKNAEPVREKTPEPVLVLNAAKTGVINLNQKNASLKHMPNYLNSSQIAASNKRKADKLSEAKEREESAKKLKLATDKVEAKKQQLTPKDSAGNSGTSSTSPTPSVPSLSTSAAPSPALSESPAPPPQLLESQIKKRKYERDPDGVDQARAEIAKRHKENHERAAREEREQEQHRKYMARFMAEQAAKKASQEQTASPADATSKKRKSDDIGDLFEDPQDREKRLKGSDGRQMTEQEEADFNLHWISSQADEYDARAKVGIAPSAEKQGQLKELFTGISSDPTLLSLSTVGQDGATEDTVVEALEEDTPSMGTIKSALAEKKSNKFYYVNELKEQTKYERQKAEGKKENVQGLTTEESVVRDMLAVGGCGAEEEDDGGAGQGVA